jgi:hypothetical protein
MARFGFSGDLGNVDTLTGIGWNFEGFSKGKGGKKAIELSDACSNDGSFSSSFKAKGKKVKGWLTMEDIPGDGMDASFNYQGKDYDFTPGERVKIKLTKKNRNQVIDHDLSLDQERPDPVTGGGGTGGGGETGGQLGKDWLNLLDTNGDGVFNSRDLLIDPDRFNLLRQAELSPGSLDAIAEQNNPIGDLPDILLSPGSGFNQQELVNIFNMDVINPPSGLQPDPNLGGMGL